MGDETKPRPVVVSACLLGQPCRYDGHAKASEAVGRIVSRHRAAGGQVVAVCPEELGGLPTPRPAAELHRGDGQEVIEGAASVRVVADHRDVTAAFVRGAHAALALARGAQHAWLKARSPSCGVGNTHIDGGVRPGDGVFTALLRQAGVSVATEEDADHASR